MSQKDGLENQRPHRGDRRDRDQRDSLSRKIWNEEVAEEDAEGGENRLCLDDYFVECGKRLAALPLNHGARDTMLAF